MELSLMVSAGFALAGAAILFFAVFFRRRSGFRAGRTLSRDDVMLRSERHRLHGRPDRIVRRGKHLIIEDKKSGRRVYPSHRVQTGVYLLLTEEHYGERPAYAVVVLGNGRRVKVKNTSALRREVLDIVSSIRTAREHASKELLATASPGKCRGCAQRSNCNQRAG